MATKLISALLIATYFTVRFGLQSELERMGTYATYYFEVGFVLLAFVFYLGRLRWGAPPTKIFWIDGPVALAAGAFVYSSALAMGLSIPFDMHKHETLAWLLLFGPLLEELLFRFALWEAFRSWVAQARPHVVFMSALSASAHLAAYMTVPEYLRGFVLFQGIFAAALGLACGWRRQQTKTLWAPLWIHFAFNAGLVGAFLLVG